MNITEDADNALIAEKIAAAEYWIAIYIGPRWTPDGTPEPLKEAIRQFVAHLHENQEVTLVDVNYGGDVPRPVRPDGPLSGVVILMSVQLSRQFKRLTAIPKAVRSAVHPSLIRSWEELTQRMRHLAPEDTSDLMGSIAITQPAMRNG